MGFIAVRSVVNIVCIYIYIKYVYIVDMYVSKYVCMCMHSNLYYFTLILSFNLFFLLFFLFQLKSFNNSLLEIEESYQNNLHSINQQYQSCESYNNVLEKEMSAALK